LIRRDEIDHDSARGSGPSSPTAHEPASGFRVLLTCRPLLLLALSLAIFHLGNAAMLPLYGLAVVSAHQGDPNAVTAATIVIAQLVMLVAACFANRLIQRIGYWGVILITFLALPVRGVVAAMLIAAWGVWPVQALDGIGAGLQSVAVPALVVRLLQGTGRVNVGQGVVMTLQGMGAALSPALGGMLAQHFGYATAFLALGAVSTGSLALWLLCGSTLKKACGRHCDNTKNTPLTT
ncbi:MAG: MFS transporter, partial [Paraburkholderia tropica]